MIPPAADAIPTLSSLHEALAAGLPDEAERWESARANEDYYQLRNEAYIERRPSEEPQDFQARPKRTSKMTRTVVRKLSNPLYKTGPTRRLKTSAGADAWLQQVYADVHVNAKMQSANRAAILNGVAAIQVEATGDPKRPVRLWLWKGHEFAAWTVDGDCEHPWAIACRDLLPAGMGKLKARIRAWSAAEYQVYLSDPFARGDAASGKRLTLVEGAANPYGVLPFVFVRNEPADCDFWGGGIGSALRSCNAEIDRELSDIAEHAREFLNPRAFLRNVATNTRFLERVGAFLHLKPPPGAVEGDNTMQPDAFYLQAESGVEAAWYNVKSYADLTIEELEVPLTAVRSDAATDLSGIAIVAKTLPLIEYTRERQPQFTEHEANLAQCILAVAGGGYDGGEGLLSAAADPQFECIWPEPCLPIPTPERDQQDAAELDAGLTDPIEVLARRRGLTLQQAEDLAMAIAARRKRWNAIMKDTEPAPEPQGDGTEADRAETADETETDGQDPGTDD